MLQQQERLGCCTPRSSATGGCRIKEGSDVRKEQRVHLVLKSCGRRPMVFMVPSQHASDRVYAQPEEVIQMAGDYLGDQQVPFVITWLHGFYLLIVTSPE